MSDPRPVRYFWRATRPRDPACLQKRCTHICWPYPLRMVLLCPSTADSAIPLAFRRRTSIHRTRHNGEPVEMPLDPAPSPRNQKMRFRTRFLGKESCSSPPFLLCRLSCCVESCKIRTNTVCFQIMARNFKYIDTHRQPSLPAVWHASHDLDDRSGTNPVP